MKIIAIIALLSLCSCAKPMIIQTSMDIVYADGKQTTKAYRIHGMPNMDDFKPFHVAHGNIVYGSWYGDHILERDVLSFKVNSFRVSVK